jgi:hypothetical protein
MELLEGTAPYRRVGLVEAPGNEDLHAGSRAEFVKKSNKSRLAAAFLFGVFCNFDLLKILPYKSLPLAPSRLSFLLTLKHIHSPIAFLI